MERGQSNVLDETLWKKELFSLGLILGEFQCEGNGVEESQIGEFIEVARCPYVRICFPSEY